MDLDPALINYIYELNSEQLQKLIYEIIRIDNSRGLNLNYLDITNYKSVADRIKNIPEFQDSLISPTCVIEVPDINNPDEMQQYMELVKKTNAKIKGDVEMKKNLQNMLSSYTSPDFEKRSMDAKDIAFDSTLEDGVPPSVYPSFLYNYGRRGKKKGKKSKKKGKKNGKKM
jgi:hypothetical protein